MGTNTKTAALHNKSLASPRLDISGRGSAWMVDSSGRGSKKGDTARQRNQFRAWSENVQLTRPERI